MEKWLYLTLHLTVSKKLLKSIQICLQHLSSLNAQHSNQVQIRTNLIILPFRKERYFYT
nr:MAG TPA: hypothetical protein [Caudoviricetes sp.]